MLHTYLICSMEPQEEYSRDYMEDDWYYQTGNHKEEEEDEHWDDEYYEEEDEEVYDVHKDY